MQVLFVSIVIEDPILSEGAREKKSSFVDLSKRLSLIIRNEIRRDSYDGNIIDDLKFMHRDYDG